jgi:hypothetical protein
MAAPKRTQASAFKKLLALKTRIQVCVPKPRGKAIVMKYVKNEDYFMVKTIMRVDKRIPLDFISGFSAQLRCSIAVDAINTLFSIVACDTAS